MAKKQKDKSGSVQNRAAYSRVSFLYQAAALLATATTPATAAQSRPSGDTAPEHVSGGGSDPASSGQPSLVGLSRRLVTDMRQVGLKTQIRIGAGVKHTVCKFCDTLLVEGRSCTSFIENRSRCQSKPWADVLVVRCATCQREKRFPVAAPRQKRRPFRDHASRGGPREPADIEMQDQEQCAA